jgi:KDO2-lipid IV(A) lauroyltransferase
VYLLDRLFYYGVIIPISILPFPVLYFISDGLYLIFFYIVGYRKKVVMSNLERSFPEMTDLERKAIAKKFYRHFTDLIVESLKVFTISNAEAQSRVKWIGLELFDKYYAQGRSIIGVSGHYGNWEVAAITFDQLIKHQGIALYKPLTNKFLDSKVISSRTRFGLAVMHNRKVKEEFERLKNVLHATVFLIDQSPSPHSKPTWIKFLGQDTAVLNGAERYAVDYNYPVLYIHAAKPRRGYHVFTVLEVCAQPADTLPGEITEMTNGILEKFIRERPELWLWSHRRWKHQREPTAKPA